MEQAHSKKKPYNSVFSRLNRLQSSSGYEPEVWLKYITLQKSCWMKPKKYTFPLFHHTYIVIWYVTFLCFLLKLGCFNQSLMSHLSVKKEKKNLWLFLIKQETPQMYSTNVIYIFEMYLSRVILNKSISEVLV